MIPSQMLKQHFLYFIVVVFQHPWLMSFAFNDFQELLTIFFPVTREFFKLLIETMIFTFVMHDSKVKLLYMSDILFLAKIYLYERFTMYDSIED